MRALRGSGKFAGRTVLLLALLVMAGATGLSVSAGTAAPRAQPALLDLATREPGATVQVIVQMTGERGPIDAQLARFAARVTRDLSIINAVSAEMRASDVVELAREPGVKWVSLDAPVYRSGGPDGAVDTANAASNFAFAIGADRLWAEGYQGSAVTVAVVDSGMANTVDLGSRILTRVKLNSDTAAASDQYGHGSHVAGIVGASGAGSTGQYVGAAPKVNLVSVKVTDDQGAGSTSDVVAGLQWVLQNKDLYSIKVVNISLNSSKPQSYQVDPLDAACEILWFNKIVVVVSAGNNGSGVLNPPANDPFVITVGAVDDGGTRTTADDTLAGYSAFGVTESGYNKPDVVAPGSNIVSTLASNGETLAKAHPANVVPGGYFRMSGTSMASAVTAGAAALLLQANPSLTPDQVKYRLMTTGRPFPAGNGAPYLDAYAAVHGSNLESANGGVPVSQLLNTGSSPAAAIWGSVNWSSVNWSSVNWSSVNWSSVNWSSVNWSSVNWSSDYWGN